MYERIDTIGIFFLLLFYFLRFPFPKVKVHLFFLEKVIGKVGIPDFPIGKCNLISDQSSNYGKGSWHG